MSPMGYRHWAAVARINHRLTTQLSKRAVVAIQLPVKLDEWSEPQPDVAVFKPSADFYLGKMGPGPEDVLLLVEMADSSLSYDRHTKRILYARSQTPDYWIVDLNNDEILVFRDPVGRDYATTIAVRRGASIAPLAFPDISIAAEDLLGDPTA
jgi:Uma2 family endonuclease